MQPIKSEENFRLFFLAPLLFYVMALLSACGGEGGADQSNGDENGPGSTTAMIVGLEYRVGANDRLVSTSAIPARIEVRHDENATRFVILLDGSADLFRDG